MYKRLDTISHLANVNQNCRERALHAYQNGQSKGEEINDDKDAEERKPLCPVAGIKLEQPLRKTVWRFLKTTDPGCSENNKQDEYKNINIYGYSIQTAGKQGKGRKSCEKPEENKHR